VDLTTPVTAITTAQLIDVYMGRLATWADGTRVRPILRSKSDITTLLLNQQLPAIAESMSVAEKRDGMQFALTDQDCATAIANLPGAIGTLMLSHIRADGLRLRPLTLNGVIPNNRNIADASYPEFVTLYLITGPKPLPPARRFLAFVASAAGWRILLDTAHWVPDRSNP
jgi:phosphate transport system substrate-binding protein